MTASDAAAAEGREMPVLARPCAVVILAAGKGTRMRSRRAKVLHEVGGLSMLGHVIASAKRIGAERLSLVVGHQGDQVAEAGAGLAPGISVSLQEPQLGTAHAVMQAREALAGFEGDVFVLYGDVPLIRPETLAAMAQARESGAAMVALGFETDQPTGYGRLIKDADGFLERIVEEKDATEDERTVTLCNSGVLCVDGAKLSGWLDRVGSDNAQGEYYLTDLPAIARADGARCAVAVCPESEVMGVNSRAQLAQVEAEFQNRRRAELMAAGVTLVAPDSVHLSHDTEIAEDVVVEPNVVFGPGVRVERDAQIRAFSHLEGCRVAEGAAVGPYARLRPGADIGEGARIGNFVEVKNARLGQGAKANHLSYVGDASVGAGANIGAGTITCNYDGYLKHRTEIGAGAFIGSNTALVAPVSVGDRAVVAAGSTITDSVEADALALGRARQSTRPGLGKRLREALAEAKAALKARKDGA